MKILESASDLQAMIAQGQVLEALDKYYAADCVIIEANGEIRKSKEQQRAAINHWNANLDEVHASGIGCITSNEREGISCIESWMEASFKNGKRFRLEEVAVQKWADGKIVHERFYYNAP